MKSLYLSLLSSDKYLSEIQKQSGINPGYAGAKFNRLIVKGLTANGVQSETLSSIPANSECSQKCWFSLNEEENGILYHYVPFINFKGLKQLCTISYTFLYVLFWGAFHKKDRFLLLDILNVSLCLSAIAACKITGVKTVGIVTDMPGMIVASSHKQDNKKINSPSKNTRLNKNYISRFDCYVFLTEQINDVINVYNKPYIIMEGLVDSEISLETPPINVSDKKSILYAGGLHARYGLSTLVNAFMLTDEPNYRLIIYGSGPYVEELKEKCKDDSRIDYRGLAANIDVMKAERNASLLVNPRPTNEDFTKYSFPSKNMEYMSVGRPLLTTKLPGMPKEYYDYVYLFEEETHTAFAKKIVEILSKSSDELTEKGQMAQKWVLKEKNNIAQTKRILDLVRSII